MIGDGASPASRPSDVLVETSKTHKEPIQPPVMEQPLCSPIVQSVRTTDHPRVEDRTTHHATEQCPPFISPSISTLDATLAHWGTIILREISSFCDDISSQMTRLHDCMARLEDIVTCIYPAPVAQVVKPLLIYYL